MIIFSNTISTGCGNKKDPVRKMH